MTKSRATATGYGQPLQKSTPLLPLDDSSAEASVGPRAAEMVQRSGRSSELRGTIRSEVSGGRVQPRYAKQAPNWAAPSRLHMLIKAMPHMTGQEIPRRRSEPPNDCHP